MWNTLIELYDNTTFTLLNNLESPIAQGLIVLVGLLAGYLIIMLYLLWTLVKLLFLPALALTLGERYGWRLVIALVIVVAVLAEVYARLS